MSKAEKTNPKKESPAGAPNIVDKIKSQVLAKIGTPPRLHRVEVIPQHNGNYRVNVWEQPEPMQGIAVTVAARIRSSYYIKASEAGEIITSNPPLAKLSVPS